MLYARFEQVSKDLGEVDQKSTKDFEELRDALDGQKQAQRSEYFVAQAVHASHAEYHTLSADFVRAESGLNEELADNRDSNELKYLRDALYLIDGLLDREARSDFEIDTAENAPHQLQEEPVARFRLGSEGCVHY